MTKMIVLAALIACLSCATEPTPPQEPNCDIPPKPYIFTTAVESPDNPDEVILTKEDYNGAQRSILLTWMWVSCAQSRLAANP